MRVIVISDMEGVAGICRWPQVTAGKSMYEEGRRLYTEEINAAVRGAFNGGATEVCVMDCHGAGGDHNFNSLIHDELDERCTYVIQRDWTEYTKFLSDGCDAALFIGMHAMAGTPDGVMSHTVSSSTWLNLWFNGTLVGETGINAALCGHWGCPVVLVTGDTATCVEARALLGESLDVVEVKQGITRSSAVMVAPKRARALIEEAAASAVSNPNSVAPYNPGNPCEIRVEFNTPDSTASPEQRQGVTITGPREAVSKGADWWQAWKQFYL